MLLKNGMQQIPLVSLAYASLTDPRNIDRVSLFHLYKKRSDF